MFNFSIYKKHNIAIDIGNSNTLVTDSEKVLFSQPSYVVINKNNNSVAAVGEKAYEMFEKTHNDLEAIQPLKGGVIADYTSAEKMLKSIMGKIHYKNSLFQGFDNIISGVPYYTTEVEKRALRDALEQFHGSHTYLLYEPLAAALGMGLNISAPDGKMIVDIGGGITEIVIISLSGIVSFNSLRVAGDTFNEDIQDYFRKFYNLSIGIKTAEQIKRNVGAVIEKLEDPPAAFMVKGKHLITGIPSTITVDHVEVAHILDKSISKIEQGIINTLETCPPELAGDIYENGIYITGGSSFLRGLKERLEAKIKLKIQMDLNALYTVSKGISQVLKEPKKYKSILFQ